MYDVGLLCGLDLIIPSKIYGIKFKSLFILESILSILNMINIVIHIIVNIINCFF